MPEFDSSPQGIKTTIAICGAVGFEASAHAFAAENKLPIINELGDRRGLCFYLNHEGWAIIDMLDGKQEKFTLRFEPKYTAQGKDPLLKAMGKASTVLDLTAGWGGDALHIAASGRAVLSIERHAVVNQLLQQAHSHLEASMQHKLRFLHLDASDIALQAALLSALGQKNNFDLVYIDPMFQGKSATSAKAKKPMDLMRRLTQAPDEGNEQRLFENAMRIAQDRVVVKRGLKAPFIAGVTPQGSIKSKLLRFDLYRPRIQL